MLAHLVRRGSFCIGSADVCFMEPGTGSIGNFAQTSLADLGRRPGLPSFTGAAGDSGASRFNQDAVTELTAEHAADVLQSPHHARLPGIARPGGDVFAARVTASAPRPGVTSYKRLGVERTPRPAQRRHPEQQLIREPHINCASADARNCALDIMSLGSTHTVWLDAVVP